MTGITARRWGRAYKGGGMGTAPLRGGLGTVYRCSTTTSHSAAHGEERLGVAAVRLERDLEELGRGVRSHKISYRCLRHV